MNHNHTTSNTIKTLGNITEYPLHWPSDKKCSTHELVIDKEFIYVTGQNMDMVAKLDYQGTILEYFKMPKGSGPHGLVLDNKGNLWVSLEFKGTVVQLNKNGSIVREVDVQLKAKDSKKPINVAPHGIGLDADGEHIWFTGKRTSTIGKFNIATEKIHHFQLENLSSLPIFLSAGANGTMWGTELFSGAILNVTPNGIVKEYDIPTSNSRPIAVIPDPYEPCMWFTEETGVKIGKIEMDGTIIEYPVPTLQKNDILASLVFDSDHNLWVQVYVDHNNPTPEGRDYLIKFDKSIRNMTAPSISEVPFSIHIVPNTGTMMHRIKMDSNGNLWFTEMMTDTVGVIRF